MMKAIIVKNQGEFPRLEIGDWEKPFPLPDEVLVKVAAAGVNRADILQKKGKYPPPKGASTVLGLEVSGVVAEIGSKVTKWKTGDEVYGLLPGGGYAEYAVIHQDMAMPKPSFLSHAEAAAIPEAFLTAYQALSYIASLKENETVLIHAGASGVGTAAIQLANKLNAEVIVTASAGKHKTCIDLGASKTIDYKTGPFQSEVMAATNNAGVDVIIDFIGALYFKQNIDCLAVDGRMVMLALIGGGVAEQADLRKILGKRLTISGSTLRSRTQAYQINLTRDFHLFASDLIQNKKLRPVVDSIFDWGKVEEAHQYMEENKNTGKIILEVS